MLDQMLGPGSEVAGHRVEGFLGRGGMGTVFRAREVDSGRAVALKVVPFRGAPDPAVVERFRSEGRAQAALEHPHVVTVYDAGEFDAGLYIAMQLVDGPSLAELIGERALGASRALALLDQVADALDAAHAKALVHRDVKPHNVLVGPADHAYLADFGLTRVADEAALTASGSLVGSVAYIAPEVARGVRATPASDRYAFAAMAFECLTGSAPFPRTSSASVLFAHVNDPVPRISLRRPELGAELDPVFDRALAKEPAERPATARELVASIRAALARTGADALPAPALVGADALAGAVTADAAPAPAVAPPAVRPGAKRRAPLLVLLAAALAGAAVVGIAWVALSEGDGDAPARPAVADRPGLQYIGADLDGGTARTVDCRGRAPGGASPACTFLQDQMPGATLVVPQNGAIRHWAVKGARGELTLSVLRPRNESVFQVSVSQTETVGSAGVHSFDTDVDVERGDRIALILTPGSSVGTRGGGEGAALARWVPPVAGLDNPQRGTEPRLASELLLRVGIQPGATRRVPRQLTGAEAAGAPGGRVLQRRRVPIGERPGELRLVRLGETLAVDALVRGRRFARMPVPELHPRAEVNRFVAAVWSPEETGLDLFFVNEGSARVVQRGYVVNRDGFTIIR